MSKYALSHFYQAHQTQIEKTALKYDTTLMARRYLPLYLIRISLFSIF